MKIIYQDLKCHRFSSIVLLLIVCLCSLPACSGRGHKCDVDVSQEVFAPKGLGHGSYLFAFESDSVGVATTTHWTKIHGRYYSLKYTMSKTEDRGRTWQPVGRGKGEVKYLKQSKENIFYLTKRKLGDVEAESSLKDRYSYELWKTGKSDFAPRCVAKEIQSDYDGVFGLHIFNDSTLCYFVENSDSIRISHNGGNTWGYIVMQQDSGYVNTGVFYNGCDDVVDFDEDKIYAGMNSIGGDFFRGKIGVFDIYSKEQKYYPSYLGFDLKASNGVAVVMGGIFYDICDDGLRRKPHKFNWSLVGRTDPKLLETHNGIMLCYAFKWNGYEKMKSCVGFSVDNGENWKGKLIDDGAWYAPKSIIPDRSGVSLIYPLYSDDAQPELHILKFQKN